MKQKSDFVKGRGNTCFKTGIESSLCGMASLCGASLSLQFGVPCVYACRLGEGVIAVI